METKLQLLYITPVIPSANILRDANWYEEKMGFNPIHLDDMYAVLNRDNLYIHLQWHADTKEDPLLGGSVIKIFVKDIQPLFNEFLERKTITKEKLNLNTAWNTHEIGFYDLNNNAIFIVEII